MKLETKRLILRPLKKSDAKDSVEGLNNLNITKWLLVVGNPYTLKDAESWIKHTQNVFGKKKKEEYPFGIELKSESKIIGGMGLDVKGDYKGKIGYWINERYWRKGYASEALEAIIKFAFNKLKLQRLETGVFAGNPSSGKLLEKFGFKKEGYKRKSEICRADGKIKDEIRYGLLKEEWENK